MQEPNCNDSAQPKICKRSASEVPLQQPQSHSTTHTHTHTHTHTRICGSLSMYSCTNGNSDLMRFYPNPKPQTLTIRHHCTSLFTLENGFPSSMPCKRVLWCESRKQARRAKQRRWLRKQGEYKWCHVGKRHYYWEEVEEVGKKWNL